MPVDATAVSSGLFGIVVWGALGKLLWLDVREYGPSGAQLAYAFLTLAVGVGVIAGLAGAWLLGVGG